MDLWIIYCLSASILQNPASRHLENTILPDSKDVWPLVQAQVIKNWLLELSPGWPSLLSYAISNLQDILNAEAHHNLATTFWSPPMWLPCWDHSTGFLWRPEALVLTVLLQLHAAPDFRPASYVLHSWVPDMSLSWICCYKALKQWSLQHSFILHSLFWLLDEDLKKHLCRAEPRASFNTADSLTWGRKGWQIHRDGFIEQIQSLDTPLLLIPTWHQTAEWKSVMDLIKAKKERLTGGADMLAQEINYGIQTGRTLLDAVSRRWKQNHKGKDLTIPHI